MYQSLYRIREKGYYGFINVQGEVVIDPQFLDASDFSQGFARVRLNDQWVPIDEQGRLIHQLVPTDH